MTSALPAIAAALALSSTPAWSQEVSPSVAEPEPIQIAPPSPVTDSTPVVPESTVTTEDSSSDTTAAAESEAAPAPAKATRSASVKKPAPARTARASTPAPAAAPVATAEAAVPAPAPAQPVVDARPIETAQAQPAPAANEQANNGDERAMMLGGGALALLAFGGAAVAVTRRRREEDEVEEEAIMDEPVAAAEREQQPVYEEQPAIVAPSAFNWGEPQPVERTVEHRSLDTRPGESWVERAHRGPTPDNPSLSLRKRLKRAAFFDAREKRIAAGEAAPVAADAGLPDSATTHRELELA